jgi:F-type H+-transporting ATPase subunit gamma
MISPRILRRRIKSVQSTAKITRAMEMISTAKMRRAQEQATSGRPYSEKITMLISNLSAETSEQPRHALLERRSTIKRIGVVHITSDKGLCGGLNANLNRLTGKFILDQKVPVSIIGVGNKGLQFMQRARRDIRADFTKMSDRPTLLDTLPISRIIIDDYTSGYIDLVYLSYNHFISTVLQKPTIEPLLPIEPAAIPKTETTEYIYEPEPSYVLGELLPRYIEMRVYQAMLEAIASEHSARMIAMRNATDNAYDIIDNLTLTLNKARQEMITTELLDITGGVEVLH